MIPPHIYVAIARGCTYLAKEIEKKIQGRKD